MNIWHNDANNRKRGGDEAEKLFAKQVKCHCGGTFQFIGDRYKGCPDFTCDHCGQLADVKSSPVAERTGNLSVSAIPWKKYPDEMLLVAKIRGKWIGEYKQFIQVQDKTPRKPTHNGNHSYLKNTEFILICWKGFRNLKELGYTSNA